MTDRRRAFLTAYLADPGRNATAAARSAGYAWPERQGSRLCSVPELAEAIRAENVKARASDRRKSMIWWLTYPDNPGRMSAAAAERRWARTPDWYRLGRHRPKGARWPKDDTIEHPNLHVDGC